MGFPCGSAGKGSACNAGDLGSIPGLGRSPGEGKGSPLQCSGLENPMDCTVHGVAETQTQLSVTSCFISLFHLVRPHSHNLPLTHGTHYSPPRVIFSVCACPVASTLRPQGLCPPGSSVHGSLQARMLEWAAISSSRGSSPPSDQTHVSCVSYIGRQILYH